MYVYTKVKRLFSESIYYNIAKSKLRLLQEKNINSAAPGLFTPKYNNNIYAEILGSHNILLRGPVVLKMCLRGRI